MEYAVFSTALLGIVLGIVLLYAVYSKRGLSVKVTPPSILIKVDESKDK